MKEKLLYQYQQELAFIRKIGAQFSAAHPKTAGNLSTNNHVEDPHVTRMIEAFALANARMHHKLETDFPEVTDNLLNILYPDYLAPVPAMSIFQFQPVLKTKEIIPVNTLIKTDAKHGEVCFFTTKYPVEILPIIITQANLSSKIKSTNAVLHLTIKYTDLNFNKLRFFINTQPQHAFALYELLFKHIDAIGIAHSPTDSNPILLDKKHFNPVGFSEHEGMLPYSKRTFMGYRLLTEFFAFPEKFLFFDLVNVDEFIRQKSNKNNTLEIYFYLNQTNSSLEKDLNASFFALNCTPVVNLYQKQAEPFELTHTKTEYPLIADSQRPPQATEIYSVKKVTASTNAGKLVEYQPFFGLKRRHSSAYYHLNRNPSRHDYTGNDIALSFMDLNFDPTSIEKWIISADIYCTNRDLPSQLPFGSYLPHLNFSDKNIDSNAKIKCLIPFSPTRHPAIRQDAQWRSTVRLALNHMSLTQSNGLEVLRSILKLYDFDNSSEYQNLFDGLLNLQTEAITARNPITQHGNVFWQGTKITLQIDETKFSGMSIYLFGCILERFFEFYAGINSFTQFVLVSKHCIEIHRWPSIG